MNPPAETGLITHTQILWHILWLIVSDPTSDSVFYMYVFIQMQPGFTVRYEVDERCPSCQLDQSKLPKIKSKGRFANDVAKLSPHQKAAVDKHEKDCTWWAQDDKHGNTKANFIFEEIKRLQEDPAMKSKFKIVIFSQHTTTLNAIGDKLIRRYGHKGDPTPPPLTYGKCAGRAACAAGCSGNHLPHKRSEVKEWKEDLTNPDNLAYQFIADHKVDGKDGVRRFEEEDSCRVLLLGKDKIKGLDMKFVTHMYTLDELFDLALWVQLVARANRLGNRGVEIHKLVARGTIEEELLKQSNALVRAKSKTGQTAVEDEGEEEKATEVIAANQRDRVIALLPKIRFLHPKLDGAAAGPAGNGGGNGGGGSNGGGGGGGGGSGGGSNKGADGGASGSTGGGGALGSSDDAPSSSGPESSPSRASSSGPRVQFMSPQPGRGGSQIATDADEIAVLRCAGCGDTKALGQFSQPQWDKGEGAARCKICSESSSARDNSKKRVTGSGFGEEEADSKKAKHHQVIEVSASPDKKIVKTEKPVLALLVEPDPAMETDRRIVAALEDALDGIGVSGKEYAEKCFSDGIKSVCGLLDLEEADLKDYGMKKFEIKQLLKWVKEQKVAAERAGIAAEKAETACNWLTRLNLPQYIDGFVERGFENVEMIANMDTGLLHAQVKLDGHLALLKAHIQQLHRRFKGD